MSRIRKCPECEMVLNDGARACGCGWKDAAATRAPGYTLGYRQCDYSADGLCCRYPGTTTDDTKTGAGPWYCLFHYERSYPSFLAEVVRASQSYQQQTRQQVLEQHQVQAVAYCHERQLDTVAQQIQSIKTLLLAMRAKMGSKVNTTWATVALDRLAKGEQVQLIVEEKANAALGVKRQSDWWSTADCKLRQED